MTRSVIRAVFFKHDTVSYILCSRINLIAKSTFKYCVNKKEDTQQTGSIAQRKEYKIFDRHFAEIHNSLN